MNLAILQTTLEQAKEFFQPYSEKTIFSIGGRGYYENPISDILAFFFNPQETHGFGTLFLDSFFEALALEKSPQCMDLIEAPQREISTQDGKRIDLLLVSNDWVLVIENKIYHSQDNPFTEYESFIKKRYNQREHIFVVLSPSGESKPDGWTPLSYKSFLRALKVNLGMCLIESQYSKWVVYLRDFILNLEQYAVRYAMGSPSIDFVERNYQDICRILTLRESYLKHIQEEGLNKLEGLLPNQKIQTTIHNWPHGPAIRFSPELWGGRSNIVIQISHKEEDKGVGVYMYVCDLSESDMKDADSKLQQGDYRQALGQNPRQDVVISQIDTKSM